METGQGPGHPLWQNIIIMRCHEACAKTKSKLTSPLERERGRSQNKSQAVPRLVQGGGYLQVGATRAGGSGHAARLLLSPSTHRTSHKLCHGQETVKGAARGAQWD